VEEWYTLVINVQKQCYRRLLSGSKFAWFTPATLVGLIGCYLASRTLHRFCKQLLHNLFKSW